MKRLLLFHVVIMYALCLQAQQYEWGKSWAGIEYYTPKNVVTDSYGNLYVFSPFATGALIGDSALMPQGAGTYTPPNNAGIAKFSPQGNLLWHKAISGGSNIWMQPLGDSAITFVCNYALATSTDRLYYLDTLVNRSGYTSSGIPNPSPEYPFHNLGCGTGTGFITLDSAGNLKEHHFLQIEYIDSIGLVPVSIYQSEIPYEDILVDKFYSVDKYGNITIFHSTYYDQVYREDSIGATPRQENLENGIKQLRIMIDNQRYIDCTVPKSAMLNNNILMLKFTPHFDSLIYCRAMIKDTIGHGKASKLGFEYHLQSIIPDNEGNNYICGYIDQEIPSVDSLGFVNDTSYYRTLYLNENDISHTLTLKGIEFDVGFVIKYDGNGKVIWNRRIETAIDTSFTFENPLASTEALDIKLDEATNSLFANYHIWAIAYPFNPDSSINSKGIFYLSDSAKIEHFKGGLFVRYNKNNGEYISNGKAFSNHSSTIVGLAVKNNQVFAQVDYLGDINLGDTIVSCPDFWSHGIGFIHWDNEGHLIGGKAYDIVSNYHNSPGPITIDNDGNLYLTGNVIANIYTDNFTLYNGSFYNYILKYTDSTFNVPYVYVPRDTISLPEEIRVGSLKIYPNPTNEEINIATSQEIVKSCTLTTLDGKEYQLKPTMNSSYGAKINLRAIPIGTYILTVKTNRNIYHNKVIKI